MKKNLKEGQLVLLKNGFVAVIEKITDTHIIVIQVENKVTHSFHPKEFDQMIIRDEP